MFGSSFLVELEMFVKCLIICDIQ